MKDWASPTKPIGRKCFRTLRISLQSRQQPMMTSIRNSHNPSKLSTESIWFRPYRHFSTWTHWRHSVTMRFQTDELTFPKVTNGISYCLTWTRLSSIVWGLKKSVRTLMSIHTLNYAFLARNLLLQGSGSGHTLKRHSRGFPSTIRWPSSRHLTLSMPTQSSTLSILMESTSQHDCTGTIAFEQNKEYESKIWG